MQRGRKQRTRERRGRTTDKDKGEATDKAKEGQAIRYKLGLNRCNRKGKTRRRN
jgi:hypothetical protein